MRKTPAPAPLATPVSALPTLEKKPAIKAPAAKTPASKTPPVKTSAPKAVAKTPAPKAPAPKTAGTKSAPPAPKVIAETPATYFTGAAGRAWRMSGKHAVAYVHTAALASELLGAEPRQVAGSAMAVYYDRKGRPFAWQFRFDTARWAEVTGRLL